MGGKEDRRVRDGARGRKSLGGSSVSGLTRFTEFGLKERKKRVSRRSEVEEDLKNHLLVAGTKNTSTS